LGRGWVGREVEINRDGEENCKKKKLFYNSGNVSGSKVRLFVLAEHILYVYQNEYNNIINLYLHPKHIPGVTPETDSGLYAIRLNKLGDVHTA
jgi:hypothetical protein